MTTEEAWKIIKDKAFPNKNLPLTNEEKMALNHMEWLVNVGAKKIEKEKENG